MSICNPSVNFMETLDRVGKEMVKMNLEEEDG